MYKLPIIEEYEKERKEIKELCIFGYGILGKVIADLIIDMGIKIKNIYDNSSSKWGLKYRGIEVVSPNNITDKSVPIVISVYEYMEEIAVQLQKIGVKNILPYYFCFYGQKIDKEFYWNNDSSIQEAMFIQKEKSMNKEKSIILQCLDIAITEKCSLKCRDCANLMQFYKNPREGDYNLNEKALNNLFNAVDLIGRVSILGGEPFLCNDLHKYVSLCCKSKKIVNILIVTNGTIIPNNEVINEIKKDDRALISISDYGNTSKRKKEIIKLSDEKNFKISISRRDGIWRELGKIEYVKKGEEEIKNKYAICENKKFLSVKDGRLYRCPFIANAHSLKAIKEEDVDYIDLANSEKSVLELRMEIKEFLSKPYHKGCQYCAVSGKDAKKIPAAIQIKQPKEYKQYI